MPAPLLYTVLAINVVTFVVFGVDKARARRGRRRVPEATLLLLSWATGLIGAWTAMSVFRHKTRKTSFRVKLAAVTVVNLLWLMLWVSVR